VFQRPVEQLATSLHAERVVDVGDERLGDRIGVVVGTREALDVLVGRLRVEPAERPPRFPGPLNGRVVDAIPVPELGRDPRLRTDHVKDRAFELPGASTRSIVHGSE
jgi:hypothetical protein